MNVSRVKELLGATVIWGEEFMDREVMMGCGCDLMSHVLAYIKEDNTLLLTGLTTPQVIYTSDAVDIKVICFVREKQPDETTIEAASKRKIVLLHTDLPMFESCGKLYKEGLIGCSEYEE